MIRSLLLLFVSAPLLGAATFFVAPNGADKNSGSEAAPWATLQHAVEKIRNGDVILVQSGTYDGFRIEKGGSAKAPKTLQAVPGAKVLIRNPGSANKHDSVIEIENEDGKVTDWIIDGFDISGGSNYGIDQRTTDRVTIQNNHVHDNGLTGIFTSHADHVTIRNNEADHNREHGIYHSNSSNYSVISGNRSHHNARSGIHMNGDINFGGPGIIRFATVESNVISDNGVEGGSGINCDGVDDSLFQFNVLTGNHASGISLYGIDAAHSSRNDKIYSNVIVMAPGSRWVVNIPDDAKSKPPVGIDIQHNILCTPDPKNGSILVWNSQMEGFNSNQNVVVDRISTDNGKSVIALAQWQALGYDKNSAAGCAAMFPAN